MYVLFSYPLPGAYTMVQVPVTNHLFLQSGYRVVLRTTHVTVEVRGGGRGRPKKSSPIHVCNVLFTFPDDNLWNNYL